MATKVLMEALSPTMEEGRVLTWQKGEGEAVKSGDVLAEVETDKAVMELQARGDGVLRKILAPAGATVEVGRLVAVIAAQDEDIDAILAEAGDGKKAEREARRRHEAPAPKPATAAATAEAPAAARARAADTDDGARVKASPLARRVAREQGVDLARITGSGPGGRIIRRDVDAAEAAPAAAAAMPLGGYHDVELPQIRKTIARRLAQSLGPIPHFFLTTEIDMERAAEARAALNALEDGVRISFNDIVVKVTAAALLQHRACNAWWQDDHIRYFNEVHISMAVAVEDGLITPVIRDAHAKSLRAIAEESRTLAQRARERKLRPDEYTGGTFSISNLGMFDIEQFTAVINPPEAGILAVGTIAAKPVVEAGAVTVRKRMLVTMSCDHRVIDGATGAQFLQTVKRMLENPLAIVW